MDEDDGLEDEEAEEDECEEMDEMLSESFSQLRHVRRPRHRYESSCSELDHVRSRDIERHARARVIPMC